MTDNGWNPNMDKAPRDGTVIDLWMVSDDGYSWREADAYFVRDCEDEVRENHPHGDVYTDGFGNVRLRTVKIKRDGWFAPNKDYDGMDGWADSASGCVHPTHWCHLPDPPATLP